MQLTITAKQVESGEALRSHVEGSLSSILEKYFGTAIEAHVVFAKEAHLIRAELSIRIGRGIVVNAGAVALDCYAAFDAAAERAAKRLRRYKRRLRQHHAKLRDTPDTGERARDYVLAPPIEEAEDADESEYAEQVGAGPAVIAEISTELPQLTVGEAAMRMDLADTPVLLFRNRSHGELNLVYRRADGNVGWIDPEFAPTTEPGKRHP
jgi:ribosomal subunit interface protein